LLLIHYKWADVCRLSLYVEKNTARHS